MSKLFIGPDTIFTGGVSLLNANIFKADTTLEKAIPEENVNAEFGDGKLANEAEKLAEGAVDDLAESAENLATAGWKGGNLAGTLKKGIATTYVILRNICAMIMLAGLIFTGIRVLVTANTPTKTAQWKQLIQDWLIGMILLIFSHVLMYGIFWISDTLTLALKDNLMGFGGLNFTLVRTCLTSFDSATQVVCLVLLGYLIYLTIIFAVAYFKRLLWVCVLIVIAPIVSIMYAFGNQTKSIYTDWMREYTTTVLVQPFHLIVYYTLVSVPLNMVSAGTLEFSTASLFTIIYALGAISFIRPAEMYIRGLFKMHQGIANMASFDSGKQTADAIVDAAKKVGLAVATVATGGATLPMAAEEMAAGEMLGGEIGSMIGELNPDNLLADIPGTDLYGQISRDPFHEDYFAGDPFFDNDLQGTPETTKWNEEELQGYLDNMYGDDPEYAEERANMERDLRAAGHGDSIEEVPEGTEDQPIRESMPEEIEATETADDNADSSATSEAHEQSNINANNVIITAANVSMQGDIQGDIEDNILDGIDTIDDESGDSEGESDEKTEEEREKNDAMFEIIDEGTPVSPKDDFLTRRKRELNAFADFSKGETGIFGALGRLSPDSMIKQAPKRIRDSKTMSKLREGKHGDKIEKVEGIAKKSIDFLKGFEELGGLKDLHAGFNQVRDTFFVGGAPGDWKTTNARMDENLKANIDQVKFNICNDPEYKNFFEQKYFLELKDQYKDNPNYNDARLMSMAKEKAESKLKSLTDTYVPLGVKDARIMLELDEDRKKYGYTAQEAVQQRIRFEKFNIDVRNVEHVNEQLMTSNSTVAESIPNARDYFNSGYTDVGSLTRAYQLTEALSLTREHGIKLDRALSNKGSKINLNLESRNDLSDKQKERVRTILESYKKRG